MAGVGNEVSITIHGLPVDSGNVRAEVFGDKFRALVKSLKLGDTILNKRKAHDYLITGLEIGSAHATLKERVSVRRVVPTSSLSLVQDAVSAVYNGDRNIKRFPKKIVEGLSPLVKDVGKTFSHGEIIFPGNNIIRIDDYLASQIEKAIYRIENEDLAPQRYFEGIALETLDGVVKEIDARGSLIRGKLILSIGGKEIDCIFRQEDISVLRDSFNLRARVESVAHYDGDSLLPVRLDVKNVSVINLGEGLVRWRGALSPKRRPGDGAE